MIRFVVLLLMLAMLLYGVFWALDRRDRGTSSGPARPLPKGPLGPDDDEAFLRNLDRERRRTTSDPPPASPPPTSQETHEHPE
ncbi:MAG: hypothetical protein JWQ74_1132 [Marmoricola sp.]|nr:hypothetical protein [Marmoricola sp.]